MKAINTMPDIFEPDIRLEHISVENFRGFEKISVGFDPELNVIIGENGSGKTSLIDCMAIMSAVFTGNLQNKTISAEKRFDLSGISHENSKLASGSQLRPWFDTRHGASELSVEAGYLFREQQITIRILVDKENDDAPEIVSDPEIRALSKSLSRRIRHGKPINLPLFAYYPAVQAPLDFAGSDGAAGGPYSIFDAYDGILGRNCFDFRSFFRWYKWQVNIEGQIGQNRILDAVKEAIYSILSDDMAEFDNLSVNWLNHPDGEMVINKNDAPFNINQLSSGEKFLLILIADLARRMVITNPERENPLLGSGVILIDEVDLHLHPAWQRNILPKLNKTFPNCQFIVTTHSPLILSRVRPRQVILLEAFKVSGNSYHTFGRDANAILYELMGVRDRPEEIQTRIDEIYELADEYKMDEAKLRLRDLSEDLGENDVEIVRAYTHINFMEEMI